MGAVCRFLLVFAVGALFYDRRASVLGAHGDHEEGEEHGGPFEELRDYLLQVRIEELEESVEVTSESITFDDTVLLVSRLLDRFECHEVLGDDAVCLACANNLTDHVYQTVGATRLQGLSEEAFQTASAVLLYLVSREEVFAVCDSVAARLVGVGAYTGGLLGADGALTEEDLDAILDEISHTYHSSSQSKCFDVETVFEAEVVDHESGATEAELFHVSSVIVANLLQGYCIGSPNRTDPDSFREHIFDKYGHDGVMSEKDFEGILGELSIGGAEEGDGGHDDHADEHDDHGHAKRSARGPGGSGLVKRATEDDHDHGHGHEEEEGATHTDIAGVDKKCYTGEELLDIFGVDHETGVTEAQFTEICPALVQQVLSGACEAKAEEPEKKPSGLVWVYGTVAVLIISLGALVGGLFVPCMSAGVYEKCVQSLIALAVAVLTGDAIIHLIPLAYGIHGHESGGHVVHSAFDPELSYVWKSLLAVVSIYGFYLLETLLGWVSGHTHANSHVNDMHMAQTDFARTDSQRKRESQADLVKNMNAVDADFAGGEGSCMTRYGPLPVMVILGDGLHNFADGLAVGAAFAAGIGPGISTSVAVLCHEIPHELGDLAILLKVGIKLKWALLLNFLSALTAFAGLYLGILLASTELARQWIFAVTAGMFLYVALADMMPQITHLKGVKDPVLVFILQNVFFILGIVFIFLLAIYEDAINFTFEE